MEHNMAPHEGLDVHELLVFKTICLTKSFTMIPLVTDEELKTILRQDVLLSRENIKELKKYIEDVKLPSHKE